LPFTKGYWRLDWRCIVTRVISVDTDQVYQKAEARRQMGLRIRRITWTTSVAIFGAGVGVSLSILFLAAGVVLMSVGVAVAVAGAMASVAVPRLVYS
jgi:hypothetical protein